MAQNTASDRRTAFENARTAAVELENDYSAYERMASDLHDVVSSYTDLDDGEAYDMAEFLRGGVMDAIASYEPARFYEGQEIEVGEVWELYNGMGDLEGFYVERLEIANVNVYFEDGERHTSYEVDHIDPQDRLITTLTLDEGDLLTELGEEGIKENNVPGVKRPDGSTIR